MDILKPQPNSLRRRSALRTAGWFLCALAAAVLFRAIAAAQSDQPGEYEVKAAFLFNFTKFLEWPDGSFDSPHAPIVIGIIGEDLSLIHI